MARVRRRYHGHYRMLIVEDHTSLRQAFARVMDAEPGLEVAGEVGTVREALRFLKTPGSALDVALIDLGLPDGDGHEVIEVARRKFPGSAVIVLTASFDREQAARAVEVGACGVIQKTTSLDELMASVRRALAGELLIPPDDLLSLLRLAADRRARKELPESATGNLTRREMEVLRCLAEGLDSRAITQRLHITSDTEHSHVSSILTKLGVHSRLQALVVAVRRGLIDIAPPARTPSIR